MSPTDQTENPEKGGGTPPGSAQKREDASLHLGMLSDDIRRREIRRRREDSAWSVFSFLLHVALFLLLLYCTPVREMIKPPVKEPQVSDAAKDLSADRIEQIAQNLSQARVNELLRQIETMQTILHNMDMVKAEIQQDYDAFAEKSAESARDRIEEMIDQVEKDQTTGLARQEVVRQKSEQIAEAERKNVAEMEVAKQLSELSSEVWYKDSIDVNESLANAQNSLDRIATEAEFAGFQETEKVAEVMRQAQVEIARNQAAAQQVVFETAKRLSSLPEILENIAKLEKRVEQEQANIERSKQEIEKTRKEMAEFKQRQEQLASEKTKLEERQKEAAAKMWELDKEKRAQEQELAKARREKNNELAKEKETRVQELRKQHQDTVNENNALKRAVSAADNQIRDLERRQGQARSQIERSERAMKNAQTVLAREQEKLASEQKRQKEVEKLARENKPETVNRSLAETKQAQEKLKERLMVLRDALAKDEAKPEKLSKDERQENELVLKSASHATLEEAYEMVRALEEAVTVSFKEVKATQIGISSRVSYEQAQKLTDVAKPVRAELPEILREATPRTKEQLDRRKEAEAQVIHEADNMVEASVSMLNEALAMVQLTAKSEAVPGSPQKQVMWLREEDFTDRASEEKREQRMQSMMAAAQLTATIEQAAAEDEKNRAKDMAAVMASADAAMVQEQGEKPGEPEAQTGADGSGAPSIPSKDVGGQYAASVPPVLHGTGDDLLPGNILRTRTDSGDGIPAQWMYINSWYVIGPFPNPDRVNLRRKFAPESVVDLDATYIGKNGKTIAWQFEQARSSVSRWGKPNRAAIVPRSAEEYGIWYAYTEVFVDAECDLWIAVGSDDRSDLWVNDMKVWSSGNELKAWNIVEGYRKVHFRKGRNQILVRVENGWYSLGWSLCVSTGPEKPSL